MLAGPTVTISGHSYPVPTESGTTPIDPATASGQQIILTPKGFLPYMLFASLNEPITWTNLTPHPVRIRFEYSSVSSHLIPPGGTFTYFSRTIYTFVYRSSTGYHGTVSNRRVPNRVTPPRSTPPRSTPPRLVDARVQSTPG